MALTHYNPINSNIKAIFLLIMKETETSSELREKTSISSEFENNKKYLNFFGEDEEIEHIVKERRKKEKRKRYQIIYNKLMDKTPKNTLKLNLNAKKF
jgi:hypothetical protein